MSMSSPATFAHTIAFIVTGASLLGKLPFAKDIIPMMIFWPRLSTGRSIPHPGIYPSSAKENLPYVGIWAGWSRKPVREPGFL
jgi:hypothetical protein